MSIESTSSITRSLAESKLIDLLVESDLSSEQIKELIKYPTRRRKLTEFVVKTMDNEQLIDQIDYLEDNDFYNYSIED